MVRSVQVAEGRNREVRELVANAGLEVCYFFSSERATVVIWRRLLNFSTIRIGILLPLMASA